MENEASTSAIAIPNTPTGAVQCGCRLSRNVTEASALRNRNPIPDLMSAVSLCVEIAPDERVAIGRDAVHHAFVDNAFGRALAIERIATDQPHGHGLPQPLRSLRIRVDVLAVEFEPELAGVV